MLFYNIHDKKPDGSFYRKSSNEPAEINRRMKRNKIYWLSQILGWSLFAIVNIIVSSSYRQFSWQRTFIVLYMCFVGISLTHIFRSLIHKYTWVNLQLKKIIPRVIIASIVIGTIMILVWLTLDISTGILHFNKIRIGTLLGGIFQLSSIILLWALIYFSVHFFENYKKVEIEALIWEAAVKDFELKTLKSQLNPHFMFNALNSIRALIDEDPPSAQTAVTKLSNILRYSLKIERHETVSLAEEIQTVADYLALESIRFEERLKYNINIEPKSERVEVPPMMVQTLVENGIKHGISTRQEGGEISISSKIIDSKLHIQIINSGNIDEDALKNASGFGVSNTKHRLNLLYGMDALFSIKNVSEDSVLVEIVIPTGGIKNESFNNR